MVEGQRKSPIPAVNNTEEEEDLDALRLAALQTLRNRQQTLQVMKPPRKFNKTGFRPHQNKNLITIVPIVDPMESSSRLGLMAPRDHYFMNIPLKASPQKEKLVPAKFRHVDDSDSSDESDDEVVIEKTEIREEKGSENRNKDSTDKEEEEVSGKKEDEVNKPKYCDTVVTQDDEETYEQLLMDLERVCAVPVSFETTIDGKTVEKVSTSFPALKTQDLLSDSSTLPKESMHEGSLSPKPASNKLIESVKTSPPCALRDPPSKSSSPHHRSYSSDSCSEKSRKSSTGGYIPEKRSPLLARSLRENVLECFMSPSERKGQSNSPRGSCSPYRSNSKYDSSSPYGSRSPFQKTATHRCRYRRSSRSRRRYRSPTPRSHSPHRYHSLRSPSLSPFRQRSPRSGSRSRSPLKRSLPRSRTPTFSPSPERTVVNSRRYKSPMRIVVEQYRMPHKEKPALPGTSSVNGCDEDKVKENKLDNSKKHITTPEREKLEARKRKFQSFKGIEITDKPKKISLRGIATPETKLRVPISLRNMKKKSLTQVDTYSDDSDDGFGNEPIIEFLESEPCEGSHVPVQNALKPISSSGLVQGTSDMADNPSVCTSSELTESSVIETVDDVSSESGKQLKRHKHKTKKRSRKKKKDTKSVENEDIDLRAELHRKRAERAIKMKVGDNPARIVKSALKEAFTGIKRGKTVEEQPTNQVSKERRVMLVPGQPDGSTKSVNISIAISEGSIQPIKEDQPRKLPVHLRLGNASAAIDCDKDDKPVSRRFRLKR